MISQVLLARGCIGNLRYELVVYYDLLHLNVQILAFSILIFANCCNGVLVQFMFSLLFSGGRVLRDLQV